MLIRYKNELETVRADQIRPQISVCCNGEKY